MNIDISPYIKELLYKHNSLVIPGFGNFILSYSSSTIDHVQGMLNPPTKKIDFDKNLVTNDGKLLAYIQEKHQLNSEDATAIINSFVSKVKSQLGKREMIEIQDVGRLYKDFEDKVQFIPDPTNFRKESFGLPSISFYPILREKKPSLASNSATKKATTKKTTSTPIVKKEKESLWNSILTNKWLPYIGIALLTLFGTCIVYPKLATKSDTASIGNRVNKKPIRTETEEVEIEDPREDIVDKQLEEELEQEEERIDTESITVDPNQKRCVVSIGVFSIKENATKLIEKIFNQGYDAYPELIDRNGKTYTKVGIQFAYRTEEELNETLKKIKRIYPNAVVVEK